MNPLRVLVLEDDPILQELLGFYLRASPEPAVGFHALTLAQALDSLQSFEPEVAIVNLNLSDSRGVETLHALKDAQPSLPVVVMSGDSERTLILRALLIGARTFLIKGHPLAGPEGLLDILLRAIASQQGEEQRLAAALEEVGGIHRRELQEVLKKIQQDVADYRQEVKARDLMGNTTCERNVHSPLDAGTSLG